MTKVILTQEVSGLGSAGDVVDVKPGFARNYLLPRGVATQWTRGGEKQVEQIKAAREARLHATIEEAQDLKAKLEAQPVRVPVKAGADGRMFGSVRPGDIADAVEEAGLGSLDRRTIELPRSIKALGRYDVTAKLRDGIVANITVEVVPAK